MSKFTEASRPLTPFTPIESRASASTDATGRQHGRRPCERRARGAFTLIELLVVVSIISVLAAMLLPSLTKAKASAKRTACINQERQIYTVFALYADDMDAYLPSNHHWLQDKYLHGNASDPKGFGIMIKSGHLGNEQDPLLYCPGREHTTQGYWRGRGAGYCYYVPSNFADGQNNAGLRRLPVAASWTALVACKTDGDDLPHSNQGVTILRPDGSVFFLQKPSWGGWGFSWNRYSNQKNWDSFSLLWTDSRLSN